MSDNKPDKQENNAIPEEQLEDMAGGGFGIGGKATSEVKVRDDVKVKRDGYGLGG